MRESVCLENGIATERDPAVLWVNAMICPRCQSENSDSALFCNHCGYRLSQIGGLGATEADQPTVEPPPVPSPGGERKQITVLFTDLTGFTAMTEALDPEEVKDLMTLIFAEVARVVARYEGIVEKYVGDAIMAVFGLPQAHEDDAVRAVRVAKEVHQFVDRLSPELEEKLGRSIALHTGINTGLVVTGKMNLQEGFMGIVGDTVNVAARLTGLAAAREIVIGQHTHTLVERYFVCEPLPPAEVKGKTEPLLAYKVQAARGQPKATRRFSGLRADLTGRTAEFAQLEGALVALQDGKGALISIHGEAGSGKSRLVEELKDGPAMTQVNWLEGSAHEYSQGIPYFPLMDLLNNAWHIEEGDHPHQVRQKIESNVRDLSDSNGHIVPYIGRLYELHFPEVAEVSPEFWKRGLSEAVETIFEAMITRRPTVIYLEDLHWADPSSLELVQNLLRNIKSPAVFLCTYRPPFRLFPEGLPPELELHYCDISMLNLSTHEVQDMAASLLGGAAVPPQLLRFLEEKSGGNPFYLEEVLTSLVESKMLTRENGHWQLEGVLEDFHLPPTVQGVISARIDRLEKGHKHLLQEASVIGRAFLQEVLKQATENQQDVEGCLATLEKTDLIRIRSREPDVEYLFKHSLTQEVVYRSLLRTQRQAIHERVGTVMERLMHARLPEFYERLAYHFREARSLDKAVDYLVKAGEKSLHRYSLDEAHQYFQEAFDLLAPVRIEGEAEARRLVELVNRWSFVFYFSGHFAGLDQLLVTHKALAESLQDKAVRVRFIIWLSTSLWVKEKCREAYDYLLQALALAEEAGEHLLTAQACAQLSWACAELGLLEEGAAWGDRAEELTRDFPSDDFLFHFALGGKGYVNFLKGDRSKVIAASESLLAYGLEHSSNQCLAYGHLLGAGAPLIVGDYKGTLEWHKKTIELTVHPLIYTSTKAWQGFSLVLGGEFLEAEEALREALSFSEKYGFRYVKTISIGALGVVLIAKGEMARGMKMLNEATQSCLANERRAMYAQFKYILGMVYFQMACGPERVAIPVFLKNLTFLLKNLPFAASTAEAHLTEAVDVAREIGAESVLATSYLGLGLLHKAKKRKKLARECLDQAVRLFEKVDAHIYLRQARDARANL